MLSFPTQPGEAFHARHWEALISATAVALLRQAMEPDLLAIVLTGSLARHEGSFLEDPGGWRLLGDCELLVVLREHRAAPSLQQQQALASRMEQALLQEGLRAEISISVGAPGYLHRLPPHLFGYELRHSGKVLWGEPGVLNRIPPLDPRQLPAEDAWRLLCNRMIELLPAMPASLVQSRLTPEDAYPWIKLYLDLATSYLIFIGEYLPTYAERSQRLRQRAREADPADPFPLAPLARQVEDCTRWKLSPSRATQQLFPTPQALLQAVTYAHGLWRWELMQMTRTEAGHSDRELWRRWLRRQPWLSRGRGWAGGARRQGLAGWKHWPGWAAQAARHSPRHAIYAVGCELFFRMPELARGGLSAAEIAGYAAQLPLPGRPAGAPEYRAGDLLRQVVENYRCLAQPTRA